MQTDIAEEIREKLETIKFKMTKLKWGNILLCKELVTKLADQALSLLPKPCSKVFNCMHFRGYDQSVPMPFGSGSCSEPLGDCAIESESEDCCLECPDYEEPVCQAPASEIEEFVEEAQQQIDLDKIGEDSTFSGSFFRFRLEQACAHLTALLKRVEVLEIESKNRLSWCAKWESENHSLKAQVAQLEKIINCAGGSPPLGNLQFVDILQPLEAKVARLEAEARWIPVSERLPEETDETVPYKSAYVFVTNGISARVAYWMTYQKYWRFPYGAGWPDKVTHWKPIILPQEKGE